VPRESEEAGDDDVEDEETGRRSGKARCGAAGEGGDAEDERKGKEEAREWKGLGEERGMVDRRWLVANGCDEGEVDLVVASATDFFFQPNGSQKKTLTKYFLHFQIVVTEYSLHFQW
jgi:hypothetical protein